MTIKPEQLAKLEFDVQNYCVGVIDATQKTRRSKTTDGFFTVLSFPATCCAGGDGRKMFCAPPALPSLPDGHRPLPPQR